MLVWLRFCGWLCNSRPRWVACAGMHPMPTVTAHGPLLPCHLAAPTRLCCHCASSHTPFVLLAASQVSQVLLCPKCPAHPCPTPSTQCPDGCKVCTTDGACSACDSNFALVGGKCKPCEDSKAATCSADDLGVSEACAVSAGGLKDGKCVDCKDEVMRQGILFSAFCD